MTLLVLSRMIPVILVGFVRSELCNFPHFNANAISGVRFGQLCERRVEAQHQLLV